MSTRATSQRQSRRHAAAAAQEEEETEHAELREVAAAAEEGGDAAPAQTDDGGEAAAAAAVAAASTSQRFVLVSDHGQTSLVPVSRAAKYSSLPLRGQENESGNSTPIIRKRKLIRVPVKRGRGRPPKHGVKRFEFIEEEEEDEEDEYGEEGEGSAAPEDGEGGEDAGDGEDSLPSPLELNVYVAGNDYVLNNDQLQLPDDEAGDAKIDAQGKLLGGREYSFPVFQSAQRPDPQAWYALSIDTAKGIGFRDSFFFYRRNPLLIKLSCTDVEKVWLIENGRLPAHLRARNVTMLAVRNVFKLFGHRVVQNGQRTADDYYEKDAPEQGKLSAEAPAPDIVQQVSTGSVPTRTSERKQRELERERDRYKRRADAFTYASTDMNGNPWFTTFGDSGEAPFERAKAWTTRRANAQRAELNDENWMAEMARSVRGMNRELLTGRQERLRAFGRPYEALEGMASEAEPEIKVTIEEEEGENKELVRSDAVRRTQSSSANLPTGLYEPLTNLPHFPITSQSQRAMIERIHERPILPEGLQQPATASEGKRKLAVLGGDRVGPSAWGVASIEQRVELPLRRIGHDVVIAKADAVKEMDM